MSEPKILNETYQAQPNSIASYNYTDIAEGTGVIEFYGATGELDSGAFYYLTTNQDYTKETTTSGDADYSLTTYTKAVDVDFDLAEFNLPKDIGGTARSFISFWIGNGSTSLAGSVYVVVKIRKWDGTTETEIASAQGQTEAQPDVVTKNYHFSNIEIDVPRTHFNIGETLRITVEVWGISTDASEGAIEVGLIHDPNNAAQGSAEFTFFKSQIPFKLTDIGY